MVEEAHGTAHYGPLNPTQPHTAQLLHITTAGCWPRHGARGKRLVWPLAAQINAVQLAAAGGGEGGV